MERTFRFEKLLHLFKNILYTEENKKKYDTIVIDSLSEVSQCLVEIMKIKYPDREKALVMWGEYGDKISALVKQFRDFKPYNIVLLAHDTIDKDDSGRRFTGVDLNGKISRRIIGLLDEVFYYKKFTNDEGKQKRFLITDEHDNALAGDRSGSLELFEEPDLGLIFNKILGKEGE